MKVGSLEIDIVANLVKLREDMEKAKGMVGDAARHITDSIEGIKSGLEKLAVAFGIEKIADWVLKAVEAADQLNKLSQRVGVATEQLSQLQYAAKQAGVDNDSLTIALKKLSVNMELARGGGQKQIEMFRAIGISQNDLKGSTIDVMGKIADTYAHARDDAGKTANAIGLMGKAGDLMIPLLNGGSAAIHHMMDEANKLGLTISTEFAEKAEEFETNLGRIKSSSDKLAISLAGDLVEGLGKAMDAFAKATIEGNKLAGVVAFVQTLLTGDDQHKANVEMVETADKILNLQNVIQKIKSKGDNQTAQDAAQLKEFEGELKVLQDQYTTAMNYSHALTAEAEAQKKATDAKKEARQEGIHIQSQNEGVIAQYDAIVKKVMERINAEKSLLAHQRPLNEQETFEAKVLTDIKDAHIKLSPAQQARIKALLAESDALYYQTQAMEKKIKMMQAEYEYSKQISDDQMASDAADSKVKEKMLLDLDKNHEALKDQKEMIDAETQSLGANEDQRASMLDHLKIEQETRQKIWDIMHNTALDPAVRQEIADRTQQQADELKALDDQRLALQRNKQYMSDFESTAHEVWNAIEQGGTDTFKNIGAAIKKYLIDLLYEATIKPYVIQIAAQIFGTGPLGGTAASSLGGMGGMGGMGNLTQLFGGGSGGGFGGIGNTITNWFSGGGSTGGAVNMGTATGADLSTFYDGTGDTLGGGSGLAVDGAASGIGAALPYVGALYAASQGQYGQAAGMAIGTAIMPGIGTVVGAIIGSLVDSMSKKHGPKVEGYYNPYNSDKYYSSNSSAVSSNAATSVSAIQSQYASIVKAFNGTDPGVQFGLGYSSDPNGTAPNQAHVGVGIGGVTLSNLTNTNAGRTTQELQTAISDLTNRALLLGLQHANLQGPIATYLSRIGDATQMSADQVTQAITEIGQATQITTQAISEFTTTMASLQNNIQTFIDQLNTSDNGQTSKQDQMGAAHDAFQRELALAAGGDKNAIGAITQYAGTYLDTVNAYNGSGSQAAIDAVAYVKSQLQGLPGQISQTDWINNALKQANLPGFASGTPDFGGGWRAVGEQGMELEATGPARIFNAHDTANILSGGSDVTERLDALNTRVDKLIAVAATGLQRTATGVEAVASNTSTANDTRLLAASKAAARV